MMSSALLLDFDYYSYAGSILAASGPVASPTWTEYNDIGMWAQSMTALSGMPENGTGYRFTPAGTSSVSDAVAADFVLAPNPARDVVALANGAAASDLRIFDPTGRCVSTLVLQPGERRVLDVAGFAPGVYLVHSTTGTARRLVIE
jgi:hypothetical protein